MTSAADYTALADATRDAAADARYGEQDEARAQALEREAEIYDDAAHYLRNAPHADIDLDALRAGRYAEGFLDRPALGAFMPPSMDPSWEAVDLGPVLRGEYTQPVPSLLRREDGVGLFYAGRVNGVHADSGVGKTFVASVAAAQELDDGNAVLWIHLEDPDPGLVVGRLRALGVTADTISTGLHYRQPSAPFAAEVLADLERTIQANNVVLVIVDSLGEAFGIEGLDENKDLDVAPWFRRVARRLEATGAAMLLIDHGTKAADNPLHPSGSKRKRAAITGASYYVEAVRPLTREHGGTLRLITAKDRAGWHTRGAEAASITFTVYPDDGMTVHVTAPSQRAASSPSARLEAIASAAVAAARDLGRPASKRELVELIPIKARAEAKRAGVDYAVADGALRTEAGPRNTVHHVFVRALTSASPDPGE